MEFNLKITLGNEAMQTGEDVAGALQKVAEAVAEGTQNGGIWDINGNRVGEWELGLTDEEQDAVDVRDWQYEVANGDTRLGLAEWLEHRAEATQVDLGSWEPGENVDADEMVRAELIRYRLDSGDSLSEVNLHEWDPGENVDEDDLVLNEVKEFRHRKDVAE